MCTRSQAEVTWPYGIRKRNNRATGRVKRRTGPGVNEQLTKYACPTTPAGRSGVIHKICSGQQAGGPYILLYQLSYSPYPRVAAGGTRTHDPGNQNAKYGRPTAPEQIIVEVR